MPSAPRVVIAHDYFTQRGGAERVALALRAGLGIGPKLPMERVVEGPEVDDDGARLVHVGLGTFDGELVQNQNRDRVRPLLSISRVAPSMTAKEPI